MTKDEAIKEADSLFRWVASGCSVPTLGDLPRLYKDVQHMHVVADILDPPPPEPQTVLTTRERPCEVVPEGCVMLVKNGGGLAPWLAYHDGEAAPPLAADGYALIRLVPGDGKE